MLPAPGRRETMVRPQPDSSQQMSFLGNGGQMVTSSDARSAVYDPVTKQPLNVQGHIEQMSRFFGHPKFIPAQDPYDEYPLEVKDLYRAFDGSNPLMRKIVIDTITNSMQWPINPKGGMFQLTRHENGIAIEWTELRFGAEGMDRVPEEGTSRLVAHTQARHRATFVRFGKALEAEHGFHLTPEGQRVWAASLKQISNAATENACHGSVLALVTSTFEIDSIENDRRNDTMSTRDIEQLFRNEITLFGRANASEDGVAHILDMGQSILAGRGNNRQGNMWVLPQGFKKLARGSDFENAFIRSGRQSGNELDQLSANAQGARIETSRPFAEGENQFSDPMFRSQTCGTVAIMDHRSVAELTPDKFATSKLNVSVFVEPRDDFVQASYKRMFPFGGLFEREGDMLVTDIGRAMFGDFETWGQVLQEHDHDGRFYSTLLVKSVEAHRSLLRDIFEPAGQSRAELDAQPQDLAGQGSRMRRGLGAGLQSGGQASEQSVLQAIGSTQWPESVKMAAGKFAAWLAQLQNKVEGLHLMDAYHGLVKHYSESQGSDVTQVQWALVARKLLDVDTLVALRSVKTSPTLKPSAFEKAMIASQSSGDSSQLAAKDAQSPAWLPLQGYKSHICVISCPGESDHRNEPLVFQSLSYTLTSSAFVLFFVDDSVLDSLVQAQGKLAISSPHSEGSSDLRDGLLQLSVAMSSVYAAVRRHLRQNNNACEPSDELVAQVKALLRREGATSGTRQTLKDAAKFAARQKFAPLSAQQWAAEIEAKLFALYQGVIAGSLSSDDLQSHLMQVCSSVRSECGGQSSAEATSGAGTGARFAKNLLVQQRLSAADAQASRAEVKAEVDSQYDDALKAVAAAEAAAFPQLAKGAIVPISENVFVVDRDTLASVLVYLRSSGLSQAKAQAAFDNFVMRLRETASGKNKAKMPQGMTPSTAVAMLLRLARSAVVQGKPLADFSAASGLLLEADEARGASDRKVVQALEAADSAGRSGISELSSRFIDQARARLANPNARDNRSLTDYSERQSDAELKAAIASNNEASSTLAVREAIFLIVRGRAATTDAVRGAMSVLAPSADNAQPQAASRAFSQGVQEATNYVAANTGDAAQVQAVRAAAAESEKFSLSQLKAFLDQLPIDGRLAKWAMDHDVELPISLMLFRPNATWIMGSAAHLVAGSQTGTTWYANADFQLTDDVARKMHYGHFTIKVRTVITEPKNIVLLPNIMYKDYVGGYDLKVWDPLNEDDIASFQEGNLHKSVFVVPMWSHWSMKTSAIDITGRFHPSLPTDKETADATRYDLAPVLTQLWGWGFGVEAAPSQPSSALHFDAPEHRPRTNTLVFQDTQLNWDEAKQSFSSMTRTSGHLGANSVYPGSAAVRCGSRSHYTVPNAIAVL